MQLTTLATTVALLITMLGAGPAAATEQDNVMKVVRQWVDGLNKGDTRTAIAACAPETAIVDEFPPHEWHGEGTCAKWVALLQAYNKKIGLTEPIVTLKPTRRVDVNGDSAYVVVPADFTFKENGKDGAE